MAKRPAIHLCIDRVVPLHQKIAAAEIAKSENAENTPPPILLQPGASLHRAKMAIITGKRWQKGRTLTVRFIDGSKKQKAKTQAHAEVWSQYANIKFQFGSKGTADIRISFRADPGSWSAVGTDCMLRDAFPAKQPTMNFGWLRDDTDDVEYRRVVLHEFGHSLGAIHEHQNPKGGIEWNIPAVYAYFTGPPNNWSKEEIDFNIIQKYSITQLNATNFDPLSIMLYAFPASLMKKGSGTSNNTDLSTGDKSFIGMMYSKAGAPAAPARLLSSGD